MAKRRKKILPPRKAPEQHNENADREFWLIVLVVIILGALIVLVVGRL